MAVKNMFVLSFVLAFVISCNKSADKDSKYAQIGKAGWLVGNWESKSTEGTLSEIWEKVNDSVYNGQSYFIKAKDTLHFETVLLSQINGELTYSPTVKGQNNDKPVAFKLVSITEKQMVFENKAHDYPQKITYSKITNDSLVAEISGIQQGKPSAEKYPMKRTN